MNPENLVLAVTILEEFAGSPPDSPASPEVRQALEDLIEFVKLVHLAPEADMMFPSPGTEGC